MQYYGTRLSENISKREPEGYLLCLNVPVARTGVQEYLPEELGLSGQASPVCVLRPPGEVFSPETVASFEGMPVTNDHPPEEVDIENIQFLQMGHAHNVRRGAGDESDLLLADLIITDPHLIGLIMAGKREISCGYTYELHEENGRYVQRRIRGNHIAVVGAGRAGPRVSIKDKQPPAPGGYGYVLSEARLPDYHHERRKTPMKKPLTKLLARMAKDGGEEAVAEFIEEMMEEREAEARAAGGEAAESETAVSAEDGDPVVIEVPENRETVIDSDTAAGILERLDRLIALLSQPVPAAADTESAGESPAGERAEEIAEIVEEALETAETAPARSAAGEISEIVESILETSGSAAAEEDADACGGPDPLEARDTLRSVLKAVRPVLAEMPPARRRKVCGDIAANMQAVRRAGDSRIYAGLAASGKPAAGLSDLGRRIMASRNPCYKK